jgi:hypothetical protein
VTPITSTPLRGQASSVRRPSLPQMREGELRVWIKTSITSTVDVRWKESLPPRGEVGGGSLVPSHKGMISVLDMTLNGKL